MPHKQPPAGKPFVKGRSGNPGGRPAIIAEVRDLARAHTSDAIAALVEIVKGGKAEAARVSAAEALLNRGWGKPPQDINTTIRRTISDFTDDELAAIAGNVAGGGGAEAS